MSAAAARQRQLGKLHADSQRMLELAQAGDWGAVRELQAQQHILAKTLFAEPVAPADADAFAATLKAVITINEQVTALGQQAREGCLQEAGDQQLRRHAVLQYSENSG